MGVAVVYVIKEWATGQQKNPVIRTPHPPALEGQQWMWVYRAFATTPYNFMIKALPNEN